MSTNPTRRAVVLLSGGMDSTVLATDLVQAYGATNVDGIGIHYGQRHERELEAAADVAHALGIRYDIVDLSALAGSLRSALTTHTIDVPDGHYTDDTMAITVVPNRNAIMLMSAAGVAASRGAGAVYTAVHSGDHAVYPDCRPEFIAAASLASRLGTLGVADAPEAGVRVEAPFVNVSKTAIAWYGDHIGAPLHLSWSCYKGGAAHCGTCGTCVERREAFTESGVKDPTRYLEVA